MLKHLAGFCLFVLVFWGWIFLFPVNPLKSDNELIQEFETHKVEYEKLVSLIIEDQGVTDVNTEYVSFKDFGVWRSDIDPGFSSQHWQEYKDIFDRLPLFRFRGVSKRDGVILISSSTSACLDTSDGVYDHICVSKSFAYSEAPLETVDSLDSLGFEYSPILYKHIGNDWYIYRDYGISKPE